MLKFLLVLAVSVTAVVGQINWCNISSCGTSHIACNNNGVIKKIKPILRMILLTYLTSTAVVLINLCSTTNYFIKSDIDRLNLESA